MLPPLGEPSCLDFFVVSPALADVLGRCRVVRGVELATHRPVILEVVLRKGLPLMRFIRPKAQEYEKVYGPRICTPWTSELLERMDQQQWRRPVVGQVIDQEEVDHVWQLWCAAAHEELQSLTGMELEKPGLAYQYETFDPLAKARASTERARMQLGSLAFLELSLIHI